jgi:hypothetical protein
MRRVRWTWPLTVLWALIFGWAGALQLWPAAYWLEVRSVVVRDTVAGTVPVMDVEREVKRPFRADWTVEVERQSSRGGFYGVCTGTGSNNYRPESILPEPLTLDWWTWPVECDLTPGRYQVETRWTINPTGFPAKEVVILSPPFVIAAE